MMSTHCQTCTTRARSLCGALDLPELGRLSEIGRRRVVERNNAIVWAGDASELCANILSGILKITASTSDGREQIVGLLHPGDFVGSPFEGEQAYNIVALSQVELCVFPRAAFLRVLDASPQMERLLLRRTIANLEHARARMLMLGRFSAEERLSRFLLEMADRNSQAASSREGFELPLSRGQIADVLGLTIETVSRQMTRLRAEGIIALPTIRSVRILDRHFLERRAEAA